MWKETKVADGKTRRGPPSTAGDGARLPIPTALLALAVVAAALAIAAVPGPALAQASGATREDAAKLDCGDFATQRGAQAIFDRSPVAPEGDLFGLDEDGDGKACESAAGGVTEDGTELGKATGGDLDCVDVPSQAVAQSRLKADPSDPDGLDPDDNGVACEIVPAPYADRSIDVAPVATARSGADVDCEAFEYQQEAQGYYLRDRSDPNGLDGPNEPAERNERLVGNGYACETLPLLASNVEEFGSEIPETAPTAFAETWLSSRGLGLPLNLIAALLVTCGASILLVVRRARQRNDTPGR